jgi:hypothetical protein
MPSVASRHTAIELGGLIYLVDTGEHNGGHVRYDPASGVWSTLARLRHRCRNGTSFVIGGCLYAAGGKSNESTVQCYDITANTWTEVADMLEGRAHFGAVTIRSIIALFTVRP